MKNEEKQKIREIVFNTLYSSKFKNTEDIIFEEFGLTLDMLNSKTRVQPLPYIRMIYTNHLLSLGVPLIAIADRLCMQGHSGMSIQSRKSKDYYKYIPLFRELTDRFNNRLKEKENG
jgi:hypothetical protein